MRAINHVLTGALIGFVVVEPVAAIPLAVASHYVCDVIPHHGYTTNKNKQLRTTAFRNSLYIDAALCFGLVLILATSQPVHWLLAGVCAFAAAAPDLLSINHYLKVLARKSWRPNLYSRFATGIQWFERPVGAVVEVAWLIAAVSLLQPFIF